MRLIIYLVTIILIAGCTGSFYTVKNPDFESGYAEGVPVFLYKSVKRKVVLNRVVDSTSGKISHSMYAPSGSEKFCLPQIVQVEVAVPDYSQMYLITYESALFESRRYSIEVENGLFKSVNSLSSSESPSSRISTNLVLESSNEQLEEAMAIRERAKKNGGSKGVLLISCSE